MYGLRICGCHANEFVQKYTRIICNLDISAVERTCDRTHSHVVAIGQVKTKSGWKRRTSLAGKYPQALCAALVEAATQAHP